MQPESPADPDSTRQRLLTAAQAVIARVGWAGASSRTIAAEAGVNLALINYHFGSKAELLHAALDAAVLRLESEAPPPSSRRHPLEDAVSSAEHIAEHMEARVLLAACVEATRDPALARIVTEKLAALRAMVLAMIGGRRSDTGLATLVAAALDGLLLHRAIDPGTDVQGAARALGKLLLHMHPPRAPR